MATRFHERLERGQPIVADGGTGVLLLSSVHRLRCPEEACLRAAEAVTASHVSFIQAGAELIETNTFGANRQKLAGHFLEDEFERINSQAVKLAREAREITGADVLIGGAIGPLGEVGSLRPDAQAELFAEQAAVLEGRGADLIVLETFFDLGELHAAVEGVRSVSNLPIVALLTFGEDAETLTGLTARRVGEWASSVDVAAIGANHGAGPQAALAALEQLAPFGVPLAAMPNVGTAGRSGGRVVYAHARPEYFAEFAANARALGARIIGGCCGTTSAEVAAIAAAVREERAPKSSLTALELRAEIGAAPESEETHFARLLREGKWIVSAQLEPPFGGSLAGLLEIVGSLEQSGLVDIVDINDNSGARAAMNALMVSSAILRSYRIEPVPHVTGRDATVMGLASLLLGAHADGVRNILAVTGDPPEVGDYAGGHGVYEVDAIGLTRLLTSLNEGHDLNGKAIDAPTSFFVGVAVNPTADDLDLEVERFRQKIEAGASYAMTQLLFDFSYLDRFLERFGGPSPIPLLVGICPLWSYRLALRFHNELPGVVVPEPIQEGLRDAGASAAEYGMSLAAELMAEARERAQGVYLVAPFRKPLAILDLLA
ncbi:MAG TPA: bifunctional homocysteine S-methyltransferase/methylenetetrahydrofolate reductase [Gaiellaceae bacterium]